MHIFSSSFPKLWSNGDDWSAEQKRNSRNPTAHNMNGAISHFDWNLQNRFYKMLFTKINKIYFRTNQEEENFCILMFVKRIIFLENITTTISKKDIFCTPDLFEDFWSEENGIVGRFAICNPGKQFDIEKITSVWERFTQCTEVNEGIYMYNLIMLDLFIINVDNLTMFIYSWFLKFTFWIRDALFGFQHSWLTSQKHMIQSA